MSAITVIDFRGANSSSANPPMLECGRTLMPAHAPNGAANKQKHGKALGGHLKSENLS
jgi:hypothetical protein